MERINYTWDGNYPNLVKAALRVEINIHGQKVVIFNTHLTANMEVSLRNEHNIFGKVMFESDHEEHTRWAQLQTLTHHINKDVRFDKQVILGGDLNTGPRYPLWYQWQDLLKHRYTEMHDSMSYIKKVESTYNNDFCSRDQGQLDHIIGFGGPKIENSTVVFKEKHNMYFPFKKNKYKKAFISDHYGLLSTVEISREM